MKNSPGNTCHHLRKGTPVKEQNGGQATSGYLWMLMWGSRLYHLGCTEQGIYPFLWMGCTSRKLLVSWCESPVKVITFFWLWNVQIQWDWGLRRQWNMSPHLGTRKAYWKWFSSQGTHHRHLCISVRWSRSTLIRSCHGLRWVCPREAGNSSLPLAPADSAIQSTPSTWGMGMFQCVRAQESSPELMIK